MRSQMTYSSYAVAAAILATMSLHSWTSTRAQEHISYEEGATPILDPLDSLPNKRFTSSWPTEFRFTNSETHTNSTDSKIRKAVRTLQIAKTDAEKAEATQGISAALSVYFDTDMKQREQDIADIEARVTRLRGQLEKRREAKTKLVELQLQVLVNEAEGLGFYSQPGSDDDVERYYSIKNGVLVDGPSPGVLDPSNR